MGQWIQSRDANWRVSYTGGWCLKYVEDAFGTDHLFPSAIDAWNVNVGNGNHASEQPPAGKTVAVYFSLGNVPAGHVAIKLDDGYVASSTQAGTHPQGYLHPNLNNLISVYGKYNGGCTYLGWSEYVGHVKVLIWEDSHDETQTTDIPFTKQTIEDPTIPVGQSSITQAGVNGVRTIVYTVTTQDGAEVSRGVKSDTSTDPTPEITTIGTKQPDPVVPDVPTVPTVPTTPEIPVSDAPFVAFLKWLIALIKSIIKGDK